MPERIQRERTAGWRMPEGAVYVGRPTMWGNPFGGTDRELVIATFELWLTHTGPFTTELKPPLLTLKRIPHWAEPTAIRASLHELRGKDLACWCPLDRACHADVLLKLANEPPLTGVVVWPRQYGKSAALADQASERRAVDG